MHLQLHILCGEPEVLTKTSRICICAQWRKKPYY